MSKQINCRVSMERQDFCENHGLPFGGKHLCPTGEQYSELESLRSSKAELERRLEEANRGIQIERDNFVAKCSQCDTHLEHLGAAESEIQRLREGIDLLKNRDELVGNFNRLLLCIENIQKSVENMDRQEALNVCKQALKPYPALLSPESKGKPKEESNG